MASFGLPGDAAGSSASRRDRPNPAGFPAGPEGETPFSERDLVVAVDQLGVFALGRLRAA